MVLKGLKNFKKISISINMNKNNIFESRRPLIAILRGITPLEAESVSDVLIEAGISIIEVPLNSPQPFETIERMVKFTVNNGFLGLEPF